MPPRPIVPPPVTFRVSDRRKLLSKKDDRTPLKQPKERARHTFSEPKGVIKPQTPSQPRFRQTRLSENFSDQTKYKTAPKRVISHPGSPSRKTQRALAQSLTHRTTLGSVWPDESHLTHNRRSEGTDYHLIKHPEPVAGPSGVALKGKARCSEPGMKEPFTRPHISPEDERPIYSIDYRTISEDSPQSNDECLVNPSKTKNSMDPIEIVKTCMPVTKYTQQVISSDTIELARTSSPPVVSPPLTSERSPLFQQQTLYPLGIDIDTQCSPLTYQVLNPKAKVQSVNRGHGGWVEAGQNLIEHDQGAVDRHKPSPAPKFSRHRVISNEVPDISNHSSVSRNRHAAILSSSERPTSTSPVNPLLDVDRNALGEALEPQLEPIHPPLVLDHADGTKTCNATDHLNDVPVESILGPPASTERNKEQSLLPESFIPPSPHQDHDQVFLFSDSMAEGRSDWNVQGSIPFEESFIPHSQHENDETVFLFSDSMAEGKADWEVQGIFNSSPTPHNRECDHQQDLIDDKGDITLRPINPVDFDTNGSPQTYQQSPSISLSSQTNRVLVQETQEDQPSPIRTRILAEETQCSPKRKPLKRSLAPPTPISARIQHRRDLSKLKDQSVISNSVSPNSLPVSPHKPRLASPLKRVTNAGAWKERNKEAWKTDPDAQIVNPPFSRQANITEFFNSGVVSGSSKRIRQTIRNLNMNEKDVVSRDALFRQVATCDFLGQTTNQPTIEGIGGLENINDDDEIEDLDWDEVVVPDSDEFQNTLSSEEDEEKEEKEDLKIKEYIEKYKSRKRKRYEIYEAVKFNQVDDQMKTIPKKIVFYQDFLGTESMSLKSNDSSNLLCSEEEEEDIDISTQELINVAHDIIHDDTFKSFN
ncbi:hypothetical protein CROQUDRAFT_104593 [Cronartium quercuum f. sp. fusiforme G11]|uniref:Uncharacterized protein n=1 Tax=Cronartium quercuum f. sp. fusiforme G11 TaxID=708437 RepID=A0A9P6NMY1_9BASI|nr:hypothetical protein CROQUDRAFT_104593 [Cronartium quercuum f. sp. fusiforme G11]